MDDFTTADMPDDVPEPLRRLLGMFTQPDPAEVRRHEMAHLTDDLSIDQDKAVRILDIARGGEKGVKMDAWPEDDDAFRDLVIRNAMAGAMLEQVKYTFGLIHYVEDQGIPLDAMTDPDAVRRCFDAFLAAWDKVVVDAAEVTVPDDASALITG